MHELLAKSDRQLGMCLRMLYDEGMPGPLDRSAGRPLGDQRQGQDGVSCAPFRG